MPKDLSLPYQPNTVLRMAGSPIRRSAHLLIIEESAVLFSKPPILSPEAIESDHLLECSLANCQFKTSRMERMQEHMLTTHRTHTINLLTGSGPTSPSKSPRQVRNRFDPLKVMGDGSLKASGRLDELTKFSKVDNPSSGHPCSTPGCACSVPLTHLSGQQGFNCRHATKQPPHQSLSCGRPQTSLGRGRPAIPPPVYGPPIIALPGPSIFFQDPHSPPRRDQEPRP